MQLGTGTGTPKINAFNVYVHVDSLNRMPQPEGWDTRVPRLAYRYLNPQLQLKRFQFFSIKATSYAKLVALYCF